MNQVKDILVYLNHYQDIVKKINGRKNEELAQFITILEPKRDLLLSDFANVIAGTDSVETKKSRLSRITSHSDSKSAEVHLEIEQTINTVDEDKRDTKQVTNTQKEKTKKTSDAKEVARLFYKERNQVRLFDDEELMIQEHLNQKDILAIRPYRTLSLEEIYAKLCNKTIKLTLPQIKLLSLATLNVTLRCKTKQECVTMFLELLYKKISNIKLDQAYARR